MFWKNRVAGRLSEKRLRTIAISSLASTSAIALATMISFSASAFAQSGGLPNTTIAPAGSASSAPSGAPSTPEEVPEGVPPAPPPSAEPPPPPAAPKHHAVSHPRHASTTRRHHHAGPSEEASPVEPANAKLLLKNDAWAYSRPATSSKTLERVHAGKYVQVTGSTHYYLQVQLKGGRTAYIPISAVELTKPADKVFRLTTDAPVISEPNRYGKKLAEVHHGHDVHVIGTSLNYVKIKMKDGLEGFVPMTAVE